MPIDPAERARRSCEAALRNADRTDTGLNGELIDQRGGSFAIRVTGQGLQLKNLNGVNLELSGDAKPGTRAQVRKIENVGGNLLICNADVGEIINFSGNIDAYNSTIGSVKGGLLNGNGIQVKILSIEDAHLNLTLVNGKAGTVSRSQGILNPSGGVDALIDARFMSMVVSDGDVGPMSGSGSVVIQRGKQSGDRSRYSGTLIVGNQVLN